ncbi:alpha/beta hydrolase [Mucilaginibacter flavidus]|uniref:alpha/beta hydrolase n=1 Tax=Mucilaginibacter flavidus TaxID=2949309 RepID=UPI00209298D5|nr:alpha/beta hydrolase [Mucilaginibacter flavidus]MCO5951034.1 alpha/beta hydrolase [Mucilaginibacter flavidus]
MKKTIFFVVTLLLAVKAIAQAEPANYMAAVTRFTQYYNHDQPDSIFAMFSTEMKASLPLETFKPTTIQLKSQYGNLLKTEFVKVTSQLVVYKATFQNSTFLLNLALNPQNKLTGLLLGPYKPEDNAKTGVTLDPSLDETPIVLKTLTGTISGSLVMPKNPSGKIPLVLILADSGPTDRDGNNTKTGAAGNTYKMLANDLGKNGIATVRYDKRLVGASVTKSKESELRLEDYGDDALGLTNMLNDDQRFSKIILFGHGEGALVTSLITNDVPAKGVIAAEWAADPGDKLLRDQLKGKAGFLQDEFKAFMDSLRKGKLTPNIDPALYYIARPSIQNFIMSYCRYDPLRGVKRIKVPLLLIQGTTDKMVNLENGRRFKKSKSDATLIEIKGMNHILKDAPDDDEQNVATYSKPDLPLSAGLVPAIVEFVNKVR